MALKKILMVGVVAAMLVACGDDDGSNPVNDSDEGSSSSSSGSLSEVEGTSVTSVSSSSSVTRVTPCKTDSSDTCEYGELADERDGQIYKTVTIGDQVWMAENLNFETENSFCYNDSAEYCAEYGRLYTWAAAMDSAGFWSVNGMGCGYYKICMPTYPVRGVCPEGWHMPSKDEWGELLNFVGQLGATGSVLKSTVGWKDSEDGSGNGYDSFGFSAIPAGKGSPYDGKGFAALFWSSSTNNGDMYSFRVNLCHNYYYHFLDLAGRDWAYSVRCLKDLQAE